MNDEKILSIEDLSVEYRTSDGVVKAVNNLSLSLNRGEALGLVGETGAGKTTTALAVLNLIADPPGKIVNGRVIFEGKDLVKASKRELRKYRGEKIAMIFQDPMTALNPVKTVGNQIMEMITLHRHVSKAEATVMAQEILKRVGIAPERFHDYPHQFSGGMKQRVVIAIALACDPELLIADEPTTALDVTIQAQVLALIEKLRKERQTSLILITHDLGVVAEICDRVAIMYAGEVVEYGTLDHIYNHPRHPYTIGLFESIPDFEKKVHRLKPIPGLMPDPTNLPEGCSFAPRCSRCTEECRQYDCVLKEVEPGHYVKCIHIEGKEAAAECQQ